MSGERRNMRKLKKYVDTKFSNSEMADASAIKDTSLNELLEFGKTADAVNEVKVTNAAAGNAPAISADGDDTNIGITIEQKAAASVNLGKTGCTGVKLVVDQPLLDSAGNELIKFTKTITAVNELTVANASTGLGPVLSATGETNVPVTLKGKGTGKVILGQATSTGVELAADQPILDSSDNELVKFTKAATAVNEVTIANAAANGSPTLSATGGDTDIDLTLAAKGAGFINAPKLNPTHGVSAHDYAGGAVAWTLSAAELKCKIVTASNANGAVDAIATPTAGKMYVVANSTGQALTFKATGQTGVVVASTKTAMVRGNGTDFVRVTLDA